jgi:hypothetical protein
MKTTEELQKEYDELVSEEERLNKLVKESRAAKARLQELNGYWHCNSLISEKYQEIIESKFPLFDKDVRIVSVDDDFISLKNNGSIFTPVRYSRKTGLREDTEGYTGDAIDINKAIDILERFNENR